MVVFTLFALAVYTILMGILERNIYVMNGGFILVLALIALFTKL